MRHLPLALVAPASLAAALLLGRGAFEFDQWVVLAATLPALLGGLLFLAVHLVRRQSPRTTWLVGALVVGAASRLALFGAPFELSEDVARYHWDGMLVAHGENPYLHPPEAPELDRYRPDPAAAGMSLRSRKTLTVYPPAAQLLFAAGYALSPGSLIGFKALFLLAEAAAWLLLLGLLERLDLSRWRVLLICLSPLLLFTGYLPGHVDVLALPFLVLFLRAVLSGQPGRAGLALALCALIKPLPLVLLPAAWAELGTKRTLRLLGVAAVAGALLYLPFLGAGRGLFASTLLMAREWSFNGSLAALLESALTRNAAHAVSAALLVVAAVAGARIGRDFLERCLIAATAFVVVSPLLPPWYVIWIVPLLVLRPQPALWAFACLVPLTDFVLIGYVEDKVWALPVWVQVVEYAVFYPLLLWSLLPRISASFAART